MVLVGLVLLVLGAGWLVDSATSFARWMGVSELVIGLTVVAGGTSLPELATSLMAAIRGERDIAIGNVVGSCILNLLMVLGTASLVAAKGRRCAPGSTVVRFAGYDCRVSGLSTHLLYRSPVWLRVGKVCSSCGYYIAVM